MRECEKDGGGGGGGGGGGRERERERERERDANKNNSMVYRDTSTMLQYIIVTRGHTQVCACSYMYVLYLHTYIFHNIHLTYLKVET